MTDAIDRPGRRASGLCRGGLAAWGLALWIVLAAGCRAGQDWQPLFNGRTLAGWHEHGELHAWRVEEGQLIGELVRKSPYAYLVTDRQFGDFELKMKMLFESEAGNSGVFFRSTFPPQCPNAEHVYVARDLPEEAEELNCPQCRKKVVSVPYRQRVHIHGPQAEFAPPGAFTGAIYDAGLGRWVNSDKITAPMQQAHHFHEWNDLLLQVAGRHITVHLNGLLISDVGDHPLAPRGHIALQLHAGDRMKVRFKEIYIRPISAGEKKPAADK